MSDLRFSALMQTRLAADPQAPAFVHGEGVTTVAALAQQVQCMTAWLRAAGIGPGDRVAVWLVNRVEWLALLMAAARIGATVAAVNTRYRREEVAHILRTSGARLLVTQRPHQRLDFLAILADLDPAQVPDLQQVAVLGSGSAAPAGVADLVVGLAWPLVPLDWQQCAPDTGPDDSDPDATVVLFSTSGTTKAPKLVMHPQRTLVDHALRCVAAYRLHAPGACLLTLLPLCGAFGLNSTLAAFAAGAPVVLPALFEAGEAAALLAGHAVTHCFGSDEMVRRLAESSEAAQPFPSLRFFGFGAFTSNFTEIAQACCARGIPLHGLYGSSEVLAVFSAQAGDLPLAQRLEGGGMPVAGAQARIRIRDEATGQLLPQGQSGQIEIQAPSLFQGYFGNPAATEEAMCEGYFKTGDLGHLRPDGSLVFETRLGDAVRLGGNLVNPAEIEELLQRDPSVREAQVVAVPIQGQDRPVAFIVPEAGAAPDTAALLAPLRQSIAGYKVPQRVWMLAAFPLTQGANGNKISRAQLRQMAQERLAAEVTPSQEPA
ncbi:MAG: AMP-binding protein [Acidovorax soli]|uniref:AMP-binding protein n=1 Tax=Acidovorax soli TaxID=592050 RepID=UPI0026ED47CE|nr:AMP-binding protein [Acidovorax soli]MCM2346349.1 AMP-binding protein [Acidovorax soli]